MKIALIGPGLMSIPPNGWGAVESLIWDYYCNLKNSEDVDIINDKNLKNVIHNLNSINYDVVHIMYDDYVVITPYLKCKNIYLTTHYAYITHPNFKEKYSHYFNNIFMQTINNKNKIIINVISNKIKDVYVKYGFPENRINVLHNGAREDKFIFHENPEKKDKSIYLAKIEVRKKQYFYQSIQNIDFVGNYANSSFNQENKNYLGHWSKDKLYKNLSHYGNLILLSDGEADPLVVKEGLIAGLGVVVSECASENLDLSKPFITVIPNDKLNDITYVEGMIKNNRKISVNMRNEIRKYAIDKFSWKNVIEKYINLISI